MCIQHRNSNLYQSAQPDAPKNGVPVSSIVEAVEKALPLQK
ncbi:MAG: hypothetical protein BMS9Abin06_0028 [Gammaproteobacteria bacterium]|nr:MAG: hypothetical protein BMS9Abin06_0028 [Gammaproteobacteria bacterium]